jgi:hypothetical protein
VAVTGATDQRLALPYYAPLADDLRLRFLDQAAPITQTGDFAIYAWNATSFRAEIEQWGGQPHRPAGQSLALPVSFDQQVALLGYEVPASIARSDATLKVWTAWRVTSEGQPLSTAIFVHLLDGQGRLVAQDDRLGYPRHDWQSGDEFVQLHLIAIDKLPPGRYTLELGLYTRESNARWNVLDAAGQPIGDRILLGSIEVQP